LSVLQGSLAILRADFLERTRQYAFLLVLGLTVYAGTMMASPADAGYLASSIGGHRPYYSSAWLGTIFGTVAATLLSLVGFFLVRNSVDRDRLTRVGRILASTPMTRVSYVLGKWLSNLAVLGAILAVLTLVAAAMQLVRAEDPRVDLAALAAALWLIGLPPLAVGAALAVFVETMPVLRGALGSILLVLLWVVWLVLPSADVFSRPERILPLTDLTGLSRSMVSLYAAADAAGLHPETRATDLFQPVEGRVVQCFRWPGIAWSAQAALERLAWMGTAALIALAAAIPFDRFDPAVSRPRWLAWLAGPRRRKPRAARRRRFAWARRPAGPEVPADPGDVAEPPAAAPLHLAPLDRSRPRGRFPSLVAAEVRLMIRGHAWWWYGAGLVLVAGGLFAPAHYARHWFAPALWLWPVGIWSAMGGRETRTLTRALVFSAPRPLRRQLPATWLAGVLVGLAVALVTAVRPAVLGGPGHLPGLVIGAAFIPSLALALGTWSDANRAFEVLYVLLWYAGILGRVPALDLLGASRASIESGMPAHYLAATLALATLAVIGRHRQLRHAR
jgi:hypothetical protein